MEVQVHYRIHKSMAPVPILSHIKSIHASPSHFLNVHFNIIIPHLPLELLCEIFPKGLTTKTLYAPLFSMNVLHATPILFFKILSPEKYLVSSKHN